MTPEINAERVKKLGILLEKFWRQKIPRVFLFLLEYSVAVWWIVLFQNIDPIDGEETKVDEVGMKGIKLLKVRQRNKIKRKKDKLEEN